MARKNLLAGLTDPSCRPATPRKTPSLQLQTIRSLIGIRVPSGKAELLGL